MVTTGRLLLLLLFSVVSSVVVFITLFWFMLKHAGSYVHSMEWSIWIIRIFHFNGIRVSYAYFSMICVDHMHILLLGGLAIKVGEQYQHTTQTSRDDVCWINIFMTPPHRKKKDYVTAQSHLSSYTLKITWRTGYNTLAPSWRVSNYTILSRLEKHS